MKPPAVRRFEMGRSTILAGQDFLRDLGYTVTRGGKGNVGYRLVGPNGGRSRQLTHRQLVGVIDEERKKQGLEPILRGKK